MNQKDLELDTQQIRWRCDVNCLPFETTAEIEPVSGIVGQEDAVEALRYGLETRAPGQNVFIRGLAGTGRMTLVRQLLEQNRPRAAPALDHCYVHNFVQPGRPKLISLPPGRGPAFRLRVERLVEFIETELGPALSDDAMRTQRMALNEQLERQVRELGKPFEAELRANSLAMVPVQNGPVMQPVILPVIDGKPVAFQELERLRAAGEIDDAEMDAIHERISQFSRRLQDVSQDIQTVQNEFRSQLQSLLQREATQQLNRITSAIETEFPSDAVSMYLQSVVSDLVEHRLGALDSAVEFTRLYRVNLVHCHDSGDDPAIVVENAPTLVNLLGSIEREFVSGAVLRSDHLMIQGGSLLRASGGFLVMEAREVLADPAAWHVLMRTLRTGTLEIVPSELSSIVAGPLLKPDAIALDVKVILIGDPQLHHMLDAMDPDFPNLFKVLADFETTIERDEAGVHYYAGVIARIARDEQLLPFTREAVAELCEYGARIAGRRSRLTTRFGRLADIARESAYLANNDSDTAVKAEHIRSAIARGRRRADLPARHFRRMVRDGTIRIATEGNVVGQINGLAVVSAGPLTYGFPSRITATIGPGSAGAVNIEREAELSGAIHTKGFYILGGLMRHLLNTQHPLAFSASIAFEQSYGGIDGDSASGAEICCLLSALSGVGLSQTKAMTGAIDQHGHIQPVGAVSEKIEGFFAVCADRGLTGDQGVLIPAANAGDLMLSHEVLLACEQGHFHVYAVNTILDALSILTGANVPGADEHGKFAKGTMLAIAKQRAYDFWRMAAPATTPTPQLSPP